MVGNNSNYLKKISIDFIIEQLKLRGKKIVRSRNLDRHDLLIIDNNVKIKVKFSKLKQRSKCIEKRWEFTKMIHRSRLWPIDIFDFYLLVGFNDNNDIIKFWKISVNDNIIYRKNQIFIPIDNYGEYEKFEINILDIPIIQT